MRNDKIVCDGQYLFIAFKLRDNSMSNENFMCVTMKSNNDFFMRQQTFKFAVAQTINIIRAGHFKRNEMIFLIGALWPITNASTDENTSFE